MAGVNGDTTLPDGRVSTGVPGLDSILAGGLPADRIYLVDGDPGTGKTTLAMQFLLAGHEKEEVGLYVTLSESEAELRAIGASHGFALSPIHVHALIASEASILPENQYTVFHPSEVELGETTKAINTPPPPSRGWTMSACSSSMTTRMAGR